LPTNTQRQRPTAASCRLLAMLAAEWLADKS
jgi:hypothetical protein